MARPQNGTEGETQSTVNVPTALSLTRDLGGVSQGNLGADYDPGRAGGQGHPSGRCIKVIILPAQYALTDPSGSRPTPVRS